MPDYHVPVLLKESIQGLNIRPDGVYVDLTYGAGSHSQAILDELGPQGKLIAFDQDSDALENEIKDPRLTLVDSNFRHLSGFLDFLGHEKVQGILGDLGVSSHQLDTGERGFSYRFDERLDMRMNQGLPVDADYILNNYSYDQLVSIFSKFGEVRNSKSLARELIAQRKGVAIWTAGRLNNILQRKKVGSENKYLSQVYQALRIEVNEELEVLKEVLLAGLESLDKGGRYVVISYHSLEDRIVKRFFRSGNLEGKIEKDEFGNILTPFIPINKKIITASAEEIELNSRAKSGKLRIAEKRNSK